MEDSSKRTGPREERLKGRRIHFMGAGGIGVSAVMELARARGAVVSGCDGAGGGQVERLRSLGMDVRVGHDAAHVEACDELVYTPAIPADHPEILEARRRGLTVSVRMEMLGRLTRGPRTICVTGSHGKTTLTWMIAHLLLKGGRDPSVLVGGVVASMASNVRVGRGLEMVLEVDESDNRLHLVSPSIPVVSNIDNDHLEHYGGMDELEEAMTRFLSSTNPADPLGVLIGCGDDKRVLRALTKAGRETGRPVWDYGFGEARRFRALNVRQQGMRSRFDVMGPFGMWTDLALPQPGRHNILNTLGAMAAAWRIGLGESAIREALGCCERVGRRLEIKGDAKGIRVVDDYGHHPAEVAATLASARTTTDGRVAVLFQPHRYTRTHALLDDFARCFSAGHADFVCVLPVYAASETPIPGVDHKALVKRIREYGFAEAYAAEDRAEGIAYLKEYAQAGDTVLTQGAGDVTLAGPELLEALRASVKTVPRRARALRPSSVETPGRHRFGRVRNRKT